MVLPETFHPRGKTGCSNKKIAVPVSLLAIRNAVVTENQQPPLAPRTAVRHIKSA